MFVWWSVDKAWLNKIHPSVEEPIDTQVDTSEYK